MTTVLWALVAVNIAALEFTVIGVYGRSEECLEAQSTIAKTLEDGAISLECWRELPPELQQKKRRKGVGPAAVDSNK